jgi:hypothetical protein
VKLTRLPAKLTTYQATTIALWALTSLGECTNIYLLVGSLRSGYDEQGADNPGAEGAYVCVLRSYDSQ